MESVITIRTFCSYNGSLRDFTVANSVSLLYLSQRHAIYFIFDTQRIIATIPLISACDMTVAQLNDLSRAAREAVNLSAIDFK